MLKVNSLYSSAKSSEENVDPFDITEEKWAYNISLWLPVEF